MNLVNYVLHVSRLGLILSRLDVILTFMEIYVKKMDNPLRMQMLMWLDCHVCTCKTAPGWNTPQGTEHVHYHYYYYYHFY